MPTSAVYQPTTVTYEQQPTEQGYNCPTNYVFRVRSMLAVTRNTMSAHSWTRLVAFFVGVVMFIIGLALLIVGGIELANAPVVDNPTVANGGIGELIAGSVLVCFGILFSMLCAWSWASKVAGKDVVVMNGGAGLTALNPSTDPLVAAQYAPVRDAPPAPDDETRNLMDNKDCLSSAEESDKMLDGNLDPTLVV